MDPLNESRGVAHRWLEGALLAVLAFAAWRQLHVSAWNASNLWIVPDSPEYAISAERLASLGSYTIEIEGVAYPPGGSSWFGPLFLTPVYWLFGSELGLGIHVVFAFALLALFAAFRIGRGLAAPLGGAAAAAALLVHPQLRSWSREVLSDVPALALGLCAAWSYVARPRDRRVRDDALAGLVVGLAFALRFVYGAALLPFAVTAIRGRGRRAARLAALLGPTSAVAIATALYNAAQFGDWRRTGYHFWCPVPYDYRELTFSSRYLGQNLSLFALPELWMPLAALAVAAWPLSRGARGRALLWFAGFAALPGVVLHLFHFYSDARFHLFAVGLALVGAAGGLASLVAPRVHRLAWLAVPALAILAWFPAPLPSHPPGRRLIAEALRALTPDDAVIVTSIEPVYLEPFFRGSRRRVVPAHRGIEYADKLVAPERIDDPSPMPDDPFDHRASGLKSGGAREVVAWTALERPEAIAELVRAGRPVFVGATFEAETHVLASLRQRGLRPIPLAGAPWLVRLAAGP